MLGKTQFQELATAWRPDTELRQPQSVFIYSLFWNEPHTIQTAHS